MILFLTSSSPIPLTKKVQLEVVQDCVQLCFEYVCGRTLHNLSEQCVPVFDDLCSKKKINILLCSDRI